MKNLGLKLTKFLLFCGDGAWLFMSLWLTLIIRFAPNYQAAVWQNHWPVFSALFLFWLIIFYSFNLYELPLIKNQTDFWINYFKATALNVALAVIYFYLLSPATPLAPKTILVFLILIFTVLSFLWRKLIISLTQIKKFYQNLLFIGYEPLIQEIIPKRENQRRYGYNFKGIVIHEPLKEEVKLKQYDISQLTEIIKKEKINLVVINNPANQEIINQLFKILPLRVNFIGLTNFYENITHRIPLTIISRGWFLNNFSEGNKNFFEITKRIADVIFAVVFAVFTLPLIPLIILSVTFGSKGKVIFKQTRMGKDGRLFTAFKFRTMYQNAENSGAQWAKENDPRITRAGSLLRKTRLDEIPQLINILKGDMSFVGPRPERPEFINQLEEKIPFYRERLLVKPGLTGWAQINFPYADSIESTLKKLQYDLYYIKHRSLFLDLKIILKTLNIILKGGGR